VTCRLRLQPNLTGSRNGSAGCRSPSERCPPTTRRTCGPKCSSRTSACLVDKSPICCEGARRIRGSFAQYKLGCTYTARIHCTVGCISGRLCRYRSFVSLKALKGAMSAMSTHGRGRGSLVSQVHPSCLNAELLPSTPSRPVVCSSAATCMDHPIQPRVLQVVTQDDCTCRSTTPAAWASTMWSL
jgi:hypothetical protein